MDTPQQQEQFGFESSFPSIGAADDGLSLGLSPLLPLFPLLQSPAYGNDDMSMDEDHGGGHAAASGHSQHQHEHQELQQRSLFGDANGDEDAATAEAGGYNHGQPNTPHQQPRQLSGESPYFSKNYTFRVGTWNRDGLARMLRQELHALWLHAAAVTGTVECELASCISAGGGKWKRGTMMTWQLDKSQWVNEDAMLTILYAAIREHFRSKPHTAYMAQAYAAASGGDLPIGATLGVLDFAAHQASAAAASVVISAVGAAPADTRLTAAPSTAIAAAAIGAGAGAPVAASQASASSYCPAGAAGRDMVCVHKQK